MTPIATAATYIQISVMVSDPARLIIVTSYCGIISCDYLGRG